MVLTVEFDPLRDEGIELVRQLSDAGVSVEHIEIPGQIHGFLRFRKALTDPEWGPDAVMERIGSFLNGQDRS
jgi:acetyl esterase